MPRSYCINAVLVVAMVVCGVAVSGQMPFTGGETVGIMAVGFTPTGSLTTSRQSHSATLLPNGMVLVAGGSNGGAPFTSAELYNPATATFTVTGSLQTGRSNHSATILPNGKALIVGGVNSVGASLPSAELYDPATGTFIATGSLAVGRYAHTATLLADGTVLVAGGTPGLGGTTSAEIYDPGTGTFTATGNLIFARTQHTATLLSTGKVLVAGGFNCCAITFRRQAELYDPATGQFEETNMFMVGVGRYGHTATGLATGKVLIAGGFEGSGSSAASAAAQLFDPAAGVNGTFTATTGNLNTARGAHSATLLPSGRVLIAGGYNSTGGGVLSSAELYDPAASTFSNTGSLGGARTGAPATLLPNGHVLVEGGASGIAISTAEIFNPATATFLATNSLTSARVDHSATLLTTGNVLLVGGRNQNTALATSEIWSSTSNQFFAAGSNALPGPRLSHTATLLPTGKVLIAGGGDGTATTLSSALLYDSLTNTFSPTGNMVVARKDHTATLLANGTVLLVGGVGVSASVLTAAEIYDPASGTFTATPGLEFGRYEHTATLLLNGSVLVAGGRDALGNHPPFTFLYNPTTGTFGLTGALSVGRTGHTATLLPSGKVLVVGGSNGTSLSSIELYNPSTGTFSSGGAIDAIRHSHSATLLPDGTVLIAGGFASAPLSSTEIYFPATATVGITDNLDAPRYGHTATLLPGGRVLFAGGTDAFTLSSAERYDVGLNISDSRRPSVDAPVSVGQPYALMLPGLRFRGDSDASGGTTNASATNVPMLHLQRVDNDQMMWVRPGAASTDTSFTSTVLSGLPDGHYRVTIFTNAIPSQQRIVRIGTFSAPTGLTATVSPIPNTTNWSLAIRWNAVAGAESYEIHRRDATHPMLLYTTTSQASWGEVPHTSVSGVTKAYKVRAVRGGIYSGFSNVDITTTVSFTDAALTGVSVKLVHLMELRTAVNAVRAAALLTPANFGLSPALGVTPIQRLHISALREALDEARSELGAPAIVYTDSVLTQKVTPIRAAHFMELRAGTQ